MSLTLKSSRLYTSIYQNMSKIKVISDQFIPGYTKEHTSDVLWHVCPFLPHDFHTSFIYGQSITYNTAKKNNPWFNPSFQPHIRSYTGHISNSWVRSNHHKYFLWFLKLFTALSDCSFMLSFWYVLSSTICLVAISDVEMQVWLLRLYSFFFFF